MPTGEPKDCRTCSFFRSENQGFPKFEEPFVPSYPPDTIYHPMIKLYLAGPMRGYPKFNADNFNLWALKLRAAEYEVLTPVEMDAEDGLDFTSEETASATVRRLPNGDVDEEYYLQRDFIRLQECQGVALIEGWEESRGSQREIVKAIKADIRIREAFMWLEYRYHYERIGTSL